MVNLTRILQILLISAVIIIIKTTNLREKRGKYQFISFITTQSILSNFDLFKKSTRFMPHVWTQYLFEPIQHVLNEGREYFLFPEIDQRNRRRVLPRSLRLIRFCMRYAGWNTASLILIFGQSRQTINRDCTFIGHVIVRVLYSKYIHLALPGTAEYISWLGCGVFQDHFQTTLYAFDICKFAIYKPRVNQRDYFDGHHHEHNVGVGVMCNGYGWPCLVSAPLPGRQPDGNILRNIKTYAHLDLLLLTNHYIVADRIFRYEPPPILTAYTGYEVYIAQYLLFNYFHASCRIIIENLFGRFKTIFPIFILWIFPVDWIDLYIQAGMVMLSIILRHQEPLRAN